jgi:hypothetical protein
MQQQPCDLTKIFLVHRAAHPKLKDSIAYTADSQPWATYAAFRANLVNHAGPFDQQIARGTPGDTNGGDNARYRRNQRRNFTPHQHLKPSGGMNKPSHGKGKPKPKPDGPPTCYGCGEKGHIRKHCPKEQKVGTAAAVACNDSSEAELPACAAVDSSVRQDLLLLSSDAGQQALLHMASSAAVPAEFLQTAMFTPVVGLTVHANSFAALAEVRDAELSADASMLSEPSPDSLQDVKERYYALIADHHHHVTQSSHSINAIGPAPLWSGRKREHCSIMFATITHIPSLHKILSNTPRNHPAPPPTTPNIIRQKNATTWSKHQAMTIHCAVFQRHQQHPAKQT